MRSSRNKKLCSAQRGGEGDAGWCEGEGEGERSRFIARSQEASAEHSFNQTVTSPRGAAQRLENRSLLGFSLSFRGFCSHAHATERSADSDAVVIFHFQALAKGKSGKVLCIAMDTRLYYGHKPLFVVTFQTLQSLDV